MKESKIREYLGQYVKVQWKVRALVKTEEGILRYNDPHYALHMGKPNGTAHFRPRMVTWIKLVI